MKIEELKERLAQIEATAARALAGDHDKRSLMSALNVVIARVQMIRARLEAGDE